jgi:transcription elongation factor Elf1
MTAGLPGRPVVRVFLSLAMKKKPQKRKRRPSGRSLDAEATYVCDSCGEEIVVPVDVSAGSRQDYVEDCPVCCHPMSLHVDIDPDGAAHVEGEHE